MRKRFENKVVIVTGSGSGIGETTAIKFSEEGANVVIADINPDTGNQVANNINDKAGKSQFIETDVSDLNSVKNMVEETVKQFGPPDVLINNAGINVFNEPLKMSIEEWKRAFSVDLDGVWFGCQCVLPYMVCLLYTSPSPRD